MLEKMKKWNSLIAALVLSLCLTGCVTISHEVLDDTQTNIQQENNPAQTTRSGENGIKSEHSGSGSQNISLSEIPAYSGAAYIAINDNIPFFTEEELTTESYEFYSDLDDLGRCGVTIACIGTDLMPTEERGSISSVKPSGWINKQYDIVDGKYLYNRCHLIGYQLTGENANKQNLITGTRYLNIDGMLLFENMTADYIKETENHVLYRVTPLFDGDNLVAQGVLMEGWSVEDEGDGICFNVFCYNVQPGITIDYATGDSWLTGESAAVIGETYILNTNTKKFHLPFCSSVTNMKDEVREEYTGNREDLIAQGYDPCKRCNP